MDQGQNRPVNTPHFPYPVLLADVGGTNARFAMLDVAGAKPSPPIRLSTAGFGDIAAAAAEAFSRGGWPRPRSLLIGAAGHVADRAVNLTNAAWRIDGPALLSAMGLEQGLLLNDFETLSMALPAFAPHELSAIGPAKAGSGARLVVGPGTGLGVGALAVAGERLLPISSEAGHVGLAAETPHERAVYDQLGLGGARASAEMLLAGPGIPALYTAICTINGDQPAASDTAGIVGRALAGSTAERQTIRFLLTLLARFCGDMALTFLATGGVYLAGGILPRMAGLIDAAAFRAEFERNEAHAALLRGIPVSLIVAHEPAFVGLAAIASQPDRYLLRYDQRLWR